MTTTPMDYGKLTIWGCVLIVAAWFWKLGREITRIGEKVDTTWDFQMRRGDEELRRKGFLVRGEDTLSPHLRLAYAPLLADLKAFYQEEGYKLSARELDMAIETHFGQRLTNEICPDLGLYMGGCVRVASRLMKEP